MAVGIMAGLTALNRNLRRGTGQGVGTRAAKNVAGSSAGGFSPIGGASSYGLEAGGPTAKAMKAGGSTGALDVLFGALGDLPVSVGASQSTSTTETVAPVAPQGFTMMELSDDGVLEQELRKLRDSLGIK